MANRTMGTAATTSLNPAFIQGQDFTLANYGALLRNSIKFDDARGLLVPGAFDYQVGNGLLIIPRRGILQVFPGDYVGVDPQGWPILVSAYSIAGSGWSHA